MSEERAGANLHPLCDEVHSWPELIQKMLACETLDIDYVVQRTGHDDDEGVDWALYRLHAPPVHEWSHPEGVR